MVKVVDGLHCIKCKMCQWEGTNEKETSRDANDGWHWHHLGEGSQLINPQSEPLKISWNFFSSCLYLYSMSLKKKFLISYCTVSKDSGQTSTHKKKFSKINVTTAKWGVTALLQYCHWTIMLSRNIALCEHWTKKKYVKDKTF